MEQIRSTGSNSFIYKNCGGTQGGSWLSAAWTSLLPSFYMLVGKVPTSKDLPQMIGSPERAPALACTEKEYLRLVEACPSIEVELTQGYEELLNSLQTEGDTGYPKSFIPDAHRTKFIWKADETTVEVRAKKGQKFDLEQEVLIPLGNLCGEELHEVLRFSHQGAIADATVIATRYFHNEKLRLTVVGGKGDLVISISPGPRKGFKVELSKTSGIISTEDAKPRATVALSAEYHTWDMTARSRVEAKVLSPKEREGLINQFRR
jgi:hypothetical protein